MKISGLQALSDCLYPKSIPQRLKPVRYKRHASARLKAVPLSKLLLPAMRNPNAIALAAAGLPIA